MGALKMSCYIISDDVFYSSSRPKIQHFPFPVFSNVSAPKWLKFEHKLHWVILPHVCVSLLRKKLWKVLKINNF